MRSQVVSVKWWKSAHRVITWSADDGAVTASIS